MATDNIRERIALELSAEERAVNDLIDYFLMELAMLGYTGLVATGKRDEDAPEDVNITVQYSRTITLNGVVTVVSAINAHARSLLTNENVKD